MHVTVNEEKTKYVLLEKGECFNFLGFKFFIRPPKNNKPAPLAVPKIEARTKLFAKLREVFNSHVSQPISKVIATINPILRGWLNYYRIGHASKVFSYTKQWVIEKVRRHLRRAKGKSGFGWKRWSNEWLIERYKTYADYKVTSEKVLPV